MTIEKAKYDPDKGVVTITYQRLGGEAMDTVTLESQDAPRPEFRHAFEALAPTVRNALCMTVDVDAVTVRQVAFKDVKRGGADPVDGCIITALVKLPDFKSRALVNTPLASFLDLSEYDAPTLLQTLRDEALAYVKGKRAQSELFDDAAAAPSGDGQATGTPSFALDEDTAAETADA